MLHRRIPLERHSAAVPMWVLAVLRLRRSMFANRVPQGSLTRVTILTNVASTITSRCLMLMPLAQARVAPRGPPQGLLLERG